MSAAHLTNTQNHLIRPLLLLATQQGQTHTKELEKVLSFR